MRQSEGRRRSARDRGGIAPAGNAGRPTAQSLRAGARARAFCPAPETKSPLRADRRANASHAEVSRLTPTALSARCNGRSPQPCASRLRTLRRQASLRGRLGDEAIREHSRRSRPRPRLPLARAARARRRKPTHAIPRGTPRPQGIDPGLRASGRRRSHHHPGRCWTSPHEHPRWPAFRSIIRLLECHPHDAGERAASKRSGNPLDRFAPSGPPWRRDRRCPCP